MLCLTRKKGETITLTTRAGERITLRVASLSARQVALAFDAPASVRILRGEIETQENNHDCAAI